MNTTATSAVTALWGHARALAAGRTVPRLANLGALLLLTWSLSQWTWQVLTPPPAVVVAGASGPAGAPAGLDVQALLSAHLFGQSAATAIANLPISSLNLVLTGVVAAANGGYALISVAGQPQQPYAVGQEVVPGALLEAVYPDRAVILRHNAREALMLEGATAAGGGGGGAAAPAPTAPVTEQAPDQYLVSRADLSQYMQTPDFLTQAKLVPYHGGGFIVAQIQPGSLYQKLGLRVGDIIKDVNGRPVNTINDAMGLYQSMGQLHDIRLQIVRAGQVQYLQYQLQ